MLLFFDIINGWRCSAFFKLRELIILKSKRAIASVILALVIIVLMPLTAYAYSTVWHQYSGIDYVPNAGINSAVASGGNTVIFQGVAYGVSGKFRARIQSRPLSGNEGFTDVSNVSFRYVTPTTGQTYNTITNQMVDGQFFRLYWNIPNTFAYFIPREYRVVLTCMGSPHDIELNDITFYKQS
jgi:hypothetical protein